MATRRRMVVDPKVMLGKPVIKGTRVTVELILRKLAEGATEADVLDAFPSLTRADIFAAIRYGAAAVAKEDLLDLEPPARAAGN